MFNFLTPYLLWIRIGAVLVLLAGTFYTGYSVSSWRLGNQHKQEIIEALAKEKARYNALASDYNLAAASLEVTKAKKEIVYETITKTVDKIITRNVYSNVCLDDDGVRLINAAAAGEPSDTGKPNAKMPTTK